MRGNKSYEAKDFHTAIQEYSASILCAPLDEAGTGKEASLGLANRSAVFFEMKRFKDCVHDVKAAFRFGYPDDLHFKLHERAGKCLNELGQFSSARESFSSTLRTLPNARLKDTRKESLKKEIEQILEAIKDKPDVISEKNDSPDGSRPCPFQVWETNPMFPPLADCLDIVFNDKVGRHVITKRNIQVKLRKGSFARVEPCLPTDNPCIDHIFRLVRLLL